MPGPFLERLNLAGVKSGEMRRAPLWIIVVVALWLIVGFAMDSVLSVYEVLPSDIDTALGSGQRYRPADLIWDSFEPSGVAWGVQLVVSSFLFGGVPAAVVAVALAAWGRSRDKKWSGDWENVFFAGFVFQVSSLFLTALFLVGLSWSAYNAAAPMKEVLRISGPLLLMGACGAWGLRSWRALQGAVEQTPAMISVRRRAH